MIIKSLYRNGWSVWHFIGAAVLGATGMWVTRDAWLDILHRAMRDEEASHILLVPLVVAWLIWVRRGRLRLTQPTPSMIGPIMVLVGCAMTIFGDTQNHESPWLAGAVVVFVGCVLSVLGKDILLRFLPAIAVLFFLVPVPGMVRQQISLPLQSAVAWITEHIFDLMNIHTERSGNLISINGTDVTVAEACNGMRMVFTLLLVSYLFAFSSPLRGSVRALIIAATPLTALIANVIRLIPTLFMYAYADKELAAKTHDISAWIMLFVSFLALMGILKLMRWALIPLTRYNLASD